jgi:hypothetical protein
VSGAQIEEMLRTLREVMEFDPEEKQYTQNKGRRKMELEKARAAERGVSIYALRKMSSAARASSQGAQDAEAQSINKT